MLKPDRRGIGWAEWDVVSDGHSWSSGVLRVGEIWEFTAIWIDRLGNKQELPPQRVSKEELKIIFNRIKEYRTYG